MSKVTALISVDPQRDGKPQRIGDDANRPERRSYFPPTSTMTRISEVPRVLMRVPDTRRVNVSGP
jgi:hypothetical protein